MKYTIFLERKTRVAQFEMLTIGLSMEFDETVDLKDAFEVVKGYVYGWLDQERSELLERAAPHPKLEREQNEG